MPGGKHCGLAATATAMRMMAPTPPPPPTRRHHHNHTNDNNNHNHNHDNDNNSSTCWQEGSYQVGWLYMSTAFNVINHEGQTVQFESIFFGLVACRTLLRRTGNSKGVSFFFANTWYPWQDKKKLHVNPMYVQASKKNCEKLYVNSCHAHASRTKQVIRPGQDCTV